ncbi:GtrA family protein [Ruminococcus sp. Marseille-P6503]|uniref:GtrA family protein n=1 Tax=Ruminococcus sp. Marseille-P6503 TaxID=2364796 RepID=UPI000F52E21B|nr:GtrA family protein [Ruminococcus sp. Marseille-P6503]
MEQTAKTNGIKKKPDIFDRIMNIGLLKKFQPMYKKNKEILLYLFFGAWTTVISFVSFFIAAALIKLPDISLFGVPVDTAVTVSNIISWICAVTFSYITARVWVFESTAHGKKTVIKEALIFYGGRGFTLVVETVMMNVGVQALSINDNIMKIIASIVVLVLNYIISKLLVFKKTS